MQTIRMEFEFGSSDTSVTKTFTGTDPFGFAKVMKIKVPNFTNAVTATLSIKDADSDAIYTKSPISKDSVTLEETKTPPIVAGGSVTVTLNGAPGGLGGTVLVVIFIA
jgi:hypothetical protein